ncbi:MAG TPA: alcohol dehydrogenase catalytic domain-containing protein [Elusimicrobiota bacterium]|nr:alcohol dehydrogenase catalytic domain-containing protein [Elusimicrobiota bacterium]
MKAILYNDPSGPALQDVPMPTPAAGGALIQVEACGLCGTDLLKLRENKTGAVLGHEVVGRVRELGGGDGQSRGGAALRGNASPDAAQDCSLPLAAVRVGDRVILGHHVPCGRCHYCLRDSPSMCAQFKATNVSPGGFAQFLSVSPLHLARTVFKIPDDLPAASACHIEPLACCVRNARRLGLKAGDRAAVVGLGSIGLLTAQLLRLSGAEILGLDLDAERVKAAAPWAEGFSSAEDLRQKALALTDGRGLDAVVITAGPAALATQSLSWLRHGGTLNIFAAPHPSPAPVDFADLYHRELRVFSSYSAAPEDLRRALELIVSGAVALDALAAKPYPLESFAQAVDDALNRRVMKALLVP